jgi:DNA-binding response OmpR family regulator
MRVLLIEDSERIQKAVARGLRANGYAVDATGDGSHGLYLAQTEPYDVIVLDLMLPGMDGLTFLQRIRQQGQNTHVIILTAKDTVEDRVTGLRAGADDYLVKPFAFEELLARVEALIRRRHDAKNPRLQFGQLVVDISAKRVFVGGEPIELPPREYALLEYLILHRGRVVGRSEIESHIYDEQVEPMSNVVDAAVYSLRKKIDRGSGASYIQTRRGMGYIFDPGTA